MAPVALKLENWSQITAALDSFPTPKLVFGPEGDLDRTTWIFRGHKSAKYELEPRIERENKGKGCDWAALESMLLSEFQSKARMYMNPHDLPGPQERTSWLALMQHYGIPTRLLDFSYSPYIALYFALRERSETEKVSDASLWAIDATAVMNVAERIFWRAKGEKAKYEAERTGQPLRGRGVNLHPAFAMTDRDTIETDNASLIDRNLVAVAPTDIIRSHLNESGFVDLALPPIQNLRLSSQQGVFLLNGAERLSFSASLFTMMQGHTGEWCKLFHIPTEMILELELKLFQMNIHDLALFPDVEGLATFVRQKSRLHFAP